MSESPNATCGAGRCCTDRLGIARAEARLPKSQSEAKPELLFLSSPGEEEAWKPRPEPQCLSRGVFIRRRISQRVNYHWAFRPLASEEAQVHQTQPQKWELRSIGHDTCG